MFWSSKRRHHPHARDVLGPRRGGARLGARPPGVGGDRPPGLCVLAAGPIERVVQEAHALPRIRHQVSGRRRHDVLTAEPVVIALEQVDQVLEQPGVARPVEAQGGDVEGLDPSRGVDQAADGAAHPVEVALVGGNHGGGDEDPHEVAARPERRSGPRRLQAGGLAVRRVLAAAGSEVEPAAELRARARITGEDAGRALREPLERDDHLAQRPAEARRRRRESPARPDPVHAAFDPVEGAGIAGSVAAHHVLRRRTPSHVAPAATPSTPAAATMPSRARRRLARKRAVPTS
jgi:hypothetical protein